MSEEPQALRSRRRIVRIGEREVVLVDSITQVLPQGVRRIVVSGSHGGRSAAAFAMGVRALLYVFNDAGVGKDEAGMRGLAMLAEAGIAACAVSHLSARIGEAGDALESGVVSFTNDLAAGMGVSAGARLRPQLVALRTDPPRRRSA